jgi:hypothetical protein
MIGVGGAHTGKCRLVGEGCTAEVDAEWDLYTRSGYVEPSITADKCTHATKFSNWDFATTHCAAAA